MSYYCSSGLCGPNPAPPFNYNRIYKRKPCPPCPDPPVSNNTVVDMFYVVYNSYINPVIGPAYYFPSFQLKSEQESSFVSSNLISLTRYNLTLKIPENIKCIDIVLNYTVLQSQDPIEIPLVTQNYHYFTGSSNDGICNSSATPISLDSTRNLFIENDTIGGNLRSMIQVTALYN